MKLAPHLRIVRDEEGCVLLDSKRGLYYTVNAVGSRVLEAIEAGGDEEAIYHRLSQYYDPTATTIRSDAEAFIKKLGTLGLLNS